METPMPDEVAGFKTVTTQVANPLKSETGVAASCDTLNVYTPGTKTFLPERVKVIAVTAPPLAVIVFGAVMLAFVVTDAADSPGIFVTGPDASLNAE